MHARVPKNFILEEWLERYADKIELAPEAYRGRWAEACWPLDNERRNGGKRGGDADGAPHDATCPHRFARVHLDLGCGKGAYIIEAARHDPATLFIGIDSEPLCIARAAQHLTEAGIANALVIPAGAIRLQSIFAPNELAALTLNFPTPHPRKKEAAERLVTADALAAFRPLLAPGATVTLRTDSKPLFDYARPQFSAAGYELAWVSEDDRHDHPATPLTEYERKLGEQGARVYAICGASGTMAPSPAALAAARALPQSLYDYLPDDLFGTGYVPHGMGPAMDNLRHRRARAQRHATAQAQLPHA